MKKILFLLCSLCLVMATGCKKDESEALKPQTSRTVLMYLFQDTNLWQDLTANINDVEKGWEPGTNGTMLIYVDASTKFTQFDGKPVLLEITHDTTNRIVSKIVKTYDDVDPTDPARFRLVQEDAMRLYPADSYGLILSGHGDGFFVRPPKSKGINGSDRWGNNYLEIDNIAKYATTHYDFIVFDACLMAEATTFYQLRNTTDFVVTSVEISPGDGFAYSTELASLFTQPKADLFHFAKETSAYYQNTPKGQKSLEMCYQTIGVYRMSEMEKLAAVTKKVMEKLNLKYPELKSEIYTKIIGQEGLKSSMYYPQPAAIGVVMFHDMTLLALLLDGAGETDLVKEYMMQVKKVAIYSTGAYPANFLIDNPMYPQYSAGISFYIPSVEKEYKAQDEPFYNRFEWSAASGFTKDRE